MADGLRRVDPQIQGREPGERLIYVVGSTTGWDVKPTSVGVRRPNRYSP